MRGISKIVCPITSVGHVDMCYMYKCVSSIQPEITQC